MKHNKNKAKQPKTNNQKLTAATTTATTNKQ